MSRYNEPVIQALTEQCTELYTTYSQLLELEGLQSMQGEVTFVLKGHKPVSISIDISDLLETAKHSVAVRIRAIDSVVAATCELIMTEATYGDEEEDL